jgi:hypothetical protein
MGLGSGIRDPGSQKTYFGSRIPDPGIKKAPDTVSLIRIRNTCIPVYVFWDEEELAGPGKGTAYFSK